MRILVTGASGFIGRRLSRIAMSQPGNTVVSLGQEPCGISGIQEILADNIASEECEKAVRAAELDALVHLAGAGVDPSDRDVGRLVQTNAVLPATMVQMAARCGIRAVVISGSCSEYAASEMQDALRETAPLETTKLYGSTKAAGGILALAVGERLSVRVCIARIFNAYGPGEARHRLLPTLIRNIALGERVPLSPGEQIRDFIYLDDICEGILRFAASLLKGEMPNGAYNLCSGKGYSVRHMASVVARFLGADESILGFGDLPLRPDDVPYLVGDGSKARAALGWAPGIGLEAGLGLAIGTGGEK